jgi:hypothetical protein
MTTPKTFAGFSEEDARREAERQANVGNNQPPANTNAQPQGSTGGTLYKGIEFEPQSITTPVKYTESLERLRKAGYERHARPQEAFGLLIDGLEGKLSNGTKGVYQDMLSSSKQEWLSFAFERRGDVFIAYLDPEGMVFANRSYFRDGINFKYAEKKEFIIHATTKTYWPLLHVDDKFVEFVYGRHFQDLPEEIRKIMIRLPDEDTLSPVLMHDFSFGAHSNFGVSRGVRKAGGSQ